MAQEVTDGEIDWLIVSHDDTLSAFAAPPSEPASEWDSLSELDVLDPQDWRGQCAKFGSYAAALNQGRIRRGECAGLQRLAGSTSATFPRRLKTSASNEANQKRVSYATAAIGTECQRMPDQERCATKEIKSRGELLPKWGEVAFYSC